MSNQVGDYFKFLWPFQNVWTLSLLVNWFFFQLLFQISCKSDIQHRTEDAAATNELIGAVIEKGPTGQGCAMTRQRPRLRFFKVNGARAMAVPKARNNFTRNWLIRRKKTFVNHCHVVEVRKHHAGKLILGSM